MKDREDVTFIAGLYFGKCQVDKCTLKIESLEVMVDFELVGEYTHLRSSLRQGRISGNSWLETGDLGIKNKKRAGTEKLMLNVPELASRFIKIAVANV